MLLGKISTILIFVFLVIIILIVLYFIFLKKKWIRTKEKADRLIASSDLERKIIDIIADNNQISILEIAEKLNIKADIIKTTVDELIDKDLLSWKNNKWGIFK